MPRHHLSLPLLLFLATACGAADQTGPSEDPPAAMPLAAGAGATMEVVLDGLNAPRGLAFGPEGALYVVEPGTTVITGPCTAVFRGQNCYSGTGAVTRLFKGRREHVAQGLPSVYNPAVGDAIGVQDIAFVGRGNAIVSIGWGGSPAARAGLGALGNAFGTVIQLSAGGQWKVVADIAAVEGSLNPGAGQTDSNPYGLLSEPGGFHVVDAGGNTLLAAGGSTAHGGVLRTLPAGHVRVVEAFASTPAPPPFFQSEAVPTEVQRGRDGALYVSLLTGVPFLPGASRIVRLQPGQAPTTYLAGFKMIVDFAFDEQGGVYVLEFDTNPGFFFGGPGRLTHVAANGARTVITAALQSPTSVAIGPDGAIYVSNRGNAQGTGEVLRIMP